MSERILSRRDALKAIFYGSLGIWGAMNLPDWVQGDQFTQWFNETLWNYADVQARAAIPRKLVQMKVFPFQAPAFVTQLTHLSTPAENDEKAQQAISHLYEGLTPNKALYMAGTYLQHQARQEMYDPNSTGGMAVVIASMFPEKILARKANDEKHPQFESSSNETKPELNIEENGIFNWHIGKEYSGSGYIVSLDTDKPIRFVYTQENGDGYVIGMTPRQWMKSAASSTVAQTYETPSYMGISLEHTCPSAWIGKTVDGRTVTIAGNYANLNTFSYAPQVAIDTQLSVVERNTLITPNPFTYFGEPISAREAEVLSTMPEGGFNQWKNPYPQLDGGVGPFGDTVVFNATTGTFRFVDRGDRAQAIMDLKDDDIWTTPGEIFPTKGPNHYRGTEVFGNRYNRTLNGMMMVPDGPGYRPIAFVSTDQNKRFSPFQAQEMVRKMGTKMSLPNQSVFVNWDKHGAGGIFLGK